LLAVILLAGMTGQADAQEPQQARPLAWVEIDKPGINGEIIVTPSEINRMVTSQGVVYALDSVHDKLHRSNNGGLTFTEITTPLRLADAVPPFTQIAVAPDGARYVAVVAANDGGTVYLSDDNGNSWQPCKQNLDLDFAGGEMITCIAISNGYAIQGNSLLYHDIAIGTAKWGNPGAGGRVLTFQIGGLSGWVNNQPLVVGGVSVDVSAVSFSPGYAGALDPFSTLLVVASDGAATYLCIGKRDVSAQTTTWNGVDGYPTVIVAEGDAAGATILSSISLPSDYGGTDKPTRLVFIGYCRNLDTGLSDVYQINDAIDLRTQKLMATDTVSKRISSVAYFGTLITGKLLAGFVESIGPGGNTAQVKWRPIDPANPNLATWNPANQPPSGPGNAQVGWSSGGTVAFCGTGTDAALTFDESAFSQSPDNGNNWVQTALMNTSLIMTDLAPASDSRSLFMASFSQSGPESVWRSAGEPLGKYWSRLLNMPTNTDRVILRLSPNYSTDYTLYAIEVDNTTTVKGLTLPPNVPSNLLQISENRGNTWRKRALPRPVIDVVAASRYTLYLATTRGCIRKSSDGGFTWGDKVMTGLDEINMLAVSNNGHVFVGSRDGWVAYSTDEGVSFTKIQKPVSNIVTDVQVEADIYASDNITSAVQVVPDANYSANNIIYASENVTNSGVWRWTIGQSTQWAQIDRAITALGIGERISGLKTGPEGTLYALRSDNVTRSNGMNRTLDPLYPIAEEVEWDLIYRTLPLNAPLNIPPITIAFNPDPLHFAGSVPWIKLSGDSNENDLWAIDTANGPNDKTTGIYLFRDNLCKVGPWITGPPEVGCDPASGRNQQVDLRWEQLSLSDRYGLQLAKDQDFALRINPAISNSDNISSVTGSILIKTDPVSVTSPAVWLSPGSLPEAGADYYWRIRTYHAATGEYIRSPWSDTGSFIVKPGFPVTNPYYGPVLLSPSIGCDCAYNAPVSFSWSPYKEATQYKFELSERADMSRPLVSATLDTAAYMYTGQLRYDTAYYWRVMAVSPAPSEYSATFNFHTGTAAMASKLLIPRSQPIPLWVVVFFAAGMLAIVVLLVLIFRKWGIFP
jgi:photosystem II stability/assembly factor-like uncharacterized protein